MAQSRHQTKIYTSSSPVFVQEISVVRLSEMHSLIRQILAKCSSGDSQEGPRGSREHEPCTPGTRAPDSACPLPTGLRQGLCRLVWPPQSWDGSPHFVERTSGSGRKAAALAMGSHGRAAAGYGRPRPTPGRAVPGVGRRASQTASRPGPCPPRRPDRCPAGQIDGPCVRCP